MQILFQDQPGSRIEIVNPGDKNISSKLEQYRQGLLDPKILYNIALKIKNNIFVRTSSGKDKDNNPFKPYSDRYKKKHGKTTVNMTLTGEMMNSMTQSMISNNVAMIFFSTSSGRQKAIWHNVEGAGKSKIIRRFFGASDKDTREIQNDFIIESERVKRMNNL